MGVIQVKHMIWGMERRIRAAMEAEEEGRFLGPTAVKDEGGST